MAPFLIRFLDFRLASTADVEDTRRIDLWMGATVERAVWGRALSCCNKTPVLRSPRRFYLMAGRKRFLRSAYVALVTVSPLGMNCSKITPRSSQKRVIITFPTDGCVRIFFFLF